MWTLRDMVARVGLYGPVLVACRELGYHGAYVGDERKWFPYQAKLIVARAKELAAGAELR